MKKIRVCLIFLALAALLAVTASAADVPTKSGVYALTAETGYTLTACDAAGTAIAGAEAAIDGATVTFYAEAVRFQLTTPESLSGYQLVLALEGESAVPTASNIRYLDQKTGNGATTLTFDIYPTALTGTTYAIYLAGQTGTMTKVAGFTYYQSYKIGDADGNGAVNVNDAVAVLKHIVGNGVLTGNRLLAADADGSGSVNVNDAVAILKYIVGNGTLGKP